MQLESVLPSVLGAAGGEVRAGEERQDDGRAAHGQDGQQRKGRTGDTRGQLLRKTQVAPSGLFLVARTNFGTSYMDRKGMGRQKKHFLEKQGVQLWVQKVDSPDSF